jgi:Na+/H+ antiporter NhaD/arsenite permease-like protein
LKSATVWQQIKEASSIQTRPFRWNEAIIAMVGAAVLWLLILRQRNVEVSGLDYFRVGVVVTPLMLLAGALTIWLFL